VLLVLVRQIHSFRYDPQRRFRSWLKTIVMRTCSRLRQAEMRPEVAGTGGTVHARLLESVEARENLALLLERFADRELLELAVQRVKRRVQPTTWAAFERLAIARHPGLIVARELGLQLSWVYVARHKVQRMLREELDRLETD
jgi:RNA polymerase sigma-70 factor (ECF subfamily)